MAAAPEHYAGREQAYVKHFLLKNYFTALIYKIASAYNDIVYVDGFSGPWQSADNDFRDTSFGIALAAMRSAKAAWGKQGRDVHMRAFLVEKRAEAFRTLANLPPKYPDIEVRPYSGDFVPLVPTLLRDMPPKAFAFVFIDPKGWKIDIDAVAPLLCRPNTEVLYNFMFDFINRAEPMSDPAIVDGLNKLIKAEGWRARLQAADGDTSRPQREIRKQILVDAFSQTLAKVGKYKFVAETPILRTLADRPLYFLIYATRKAPGIEVFRRVQISTLRQQEIIRGNARQEKDSGAQTELFQAAQMTSSETSAYLASERMAAEKMLLDLAAGATKPITYGEVWPTVLTKHAVTASDLNQIAAALRKSGELIFPEWKVGKRVPSDEWHLQIGTPRQADERK